MWSSHHCVFIIILNGRMECKTAPSIYSCFLWDQYHWRFLSVSSISDRVLKWSNVAFCWEKQIKVHAVTIPLNTVSYQNFYVFWYLGRQKRYQSSMNFKSLVFSHVKMLVNTSAIFGFFIIRAVHEISLRSRYWNLESQLRYLRYLSVLWSWIVPYHTWITQQTHWNLP